MGSYRIYDGTDQLGKVAPGACGCRKLQLDC
jgi:hypothetical protein